MTLWQWINNNFPPYAEEKLINQEVEQIQETLSKFQQPIPTNNFNKSFIKIETEYICSTKPSWKGKLLSERYSFEYEGDWFQIDIPHTIMESLELEKGEEIIQPIHLDPNVLTRSETYKGITIENEKEIFLEKSFTIKSLGEDINKIFKKIDELEAKLGSWTEQFPEQTPEQVQRKLGNIQQELGKEKSWLDKWMNDEDNFYHGGEYSDYYNQTNEYNKSLQNFLFDKITPKTLRRIAIFIDDPNDIANKYNSFIKTELGDKKTPLPNAIVESNRGNKGPATNKEVKTVMKLIHDYYVNK